MTEQTASETWLQFRQRSPTSNANESRGCVRERRLNSPDQRPASDRAGERPREWLRQTACRAPTATAEDRTKRFLRQFLLSICFYLKLFHTWRRGGWTRRSDALKWKRKHRLTPQHFVSAQSSLWETLLKKKCLRTESLDVGGGFRANHTVTYRFVRPPQDVGSGSFTGRRQGRQRRSSQQVCDQIQLVPKRERGEKTTLKTELLFKPAVRSKVGAECKPEAADFSLR